MFYGSQYNVEPEHTNGSPCRNITTLNILLDHNYFFTITFVFLDQYDNYLSTIIVYKNILKQGRSLKGKSEKIHRQQTTKYFSLVRSTKTRKSNNFQVVFFLKIDYEFFRVIGVKYGNKSHPFFEISIFSLLPFIVPPQQKS